MATKQGQKSGGRKKGTPNKRTVELVELLKKQVKKHTGLSDYDPLVQLAVIAASAQADSYTGSVDRLTAIMCAKEVAQYMHAKRKALEHAVDPDTSNLQVIITGLHAEPAKPPKAADKQTERK